MKFPIAWRLGLALMLVGVLGSGLTGYFAYQASRDQLVKASEERLLTATRVLMRQVTVALKGISADVLLVAQHPQMVRILRRSHPAFQELTENNVALIFDRMMRVHPEYFQIRLIESANHGLERIRVDRGLGSIFRVDDAELQEKGHYPYVFDTLHLSPGAVYVSRATINHEVGAHAGEERPALQVAAPVHDADNKAIGVVVINVDLQGLFAQLAGDLPPELKLYLTNGQGDFLIHPDPARSFAFDRGQNARVQEEFPAAAALLSSGQRHEDYVVTSGTHTADTSEALVAAFVYQSLRGLESEDEYILGLSQPLASVLAESNRLAAETLSIVLIFSALAVLLAIFLARALVRPLSQMVAEVRRFSSDGSTGALPIARNDEIGELAHSIEQMEAQIHKQIQDLHEQQDKLDHLASHDSLTGLPNRRLFLDRLDQALARAKRHETQVALLFIDLDNFKTINDTHGHHAGDAVLQTVAQRLRTLLRETDMAARIGGDEFIVLIEGPCDDASMESIVRKVQASLSLPVPYQDIELESGGSIGIGRYPENGTTASTLIAAADQAMYICKTKKGR
ncbi:MAG: diguanylate cyclase [Nitrosomonadales bacterium]|nr:diguanylate cyclase [Nitrosomonadales bacterium]